MIPAYEFDSEGGEAGEPPDDGWTPFDLEEVKTLMDTTDDLKTEL